MKKKNDNIVVKRIATGLGLFTLKTIPFNKKIVEYVGPILTSEEVDKRVGK